MTKRIFAPPCHPGNVGNLSDWRLHFFVVPEVRLSPRAKRELESLTIRDPGVTKHALAASGSRMPRKAIALGLRQSLSFPRLRDDEVSSLHSPRKPSFWDEGAVP